MNICIPEWILWTVEGLVVAVVIRRIWKAIKYAIMEGMAQ